MVLKPDQERVRTLLQDTITLLCRNGLTYKNEFDIKALIGITLDKDEVFLVDIKETIKNAADPEKEVDSEEEEDNSVPNSPSRKRRKHGRKRSHGGGAGSDIESAASDSVPGTPSNNRVKAEEEDSDDAIIIKDEPGDYNTNYGAGSSNQDINLAQAQLYPASQDSIQWDTQSIPSSTQPFSSIASSQQHQQMNTSINNMSSASASMSSPLQQQQVGVLLFNHPFLIKLTLSKKEHHYQQLEC